MSPRTLSITEESNGGELDRNMEELCSRQREPKHCLSSRKLITEEAGRRYKLVRLARFIMVNFSTVCFWFSCEDDFLV